MRTIDGVLQFSAAGGLLLRDPAEDFLILLDHAAKVRRLRFGWSLELAVDHREQESAGYRGGAQCEIGQSSHACVSCVPRISTAAIVAVDFGRAPYE